MKTRILSMVLVLALLTTLRGAAQAFDQAARPNMRQNTSTVYTFPLPSDEVTEQAAALTGPQGGQAGQTIIIDHTSTDLSKIPDYWINQAKALLKASYGHTSHGSQLISGMGAFRNSLYNFNTNGVITNNVLSIADTTPGGDLGNPDRTTWASLTRTYLNGSGSNRNTVMWSWCGQAGTATAAEIDTYLNLMSQLETDYANVNFVYMTGHLDGRGVSGNLYARNNQIRNYVRQNNKVLFDFADIESYDPDGNYYPNESDGCSWCATWCTNHPTDCANLPGSCAHSHPFNCLRKGRATWWLMARLAGWPGPDASSPLTLDKSVALTHNPARPGDPITYTIVVRNTSVTDTVGVRITDTLPAYVVGADLDTTRVVTGNSAVTITVPAIVTSNVPSGVTITNTAFFSHTSGGGSDSASFTVSTLLPDFSTSTKRVNATTVQAGGLVTFTIALSNTGLAAATIRYTDTLPAQVDRVSGALTGTTSVGTGSLSVPMVIVARAKRNLVNGTVFNNTVAINDGVHAVFNIASPNVTVQAPDFSTSVRAVNKSVFEPGDYITYTLTLVNSGGMAATVRYTETLPDEVTWVSGALSGTLPVNAGASSSPLVVVAQVKLGLASGITFHNRVDVNDGYHSVFTLNFPETAIHAFYTYLPLVMRDYNPAPPPGQAIIIDHNSTDLTKIPEYWLTRAKTLALHYAHTSHGSQLLTGADWWEAQNPTYSVVIRENDTVELPGEAGALRIYDGNNVPGTTYITPDLYWSESGGIDYTRSVANTGWFGFSMWAWCGQQSDNSVETVQQYLDTLNQFETQYPAMRFIYMTGHTDGSGVDGTLYRNNNLVRQYARDHGKVMFDFADIESYDPDGNYYPDTDDSCPWCQSWCDAHPADCAAFDAMGDCAHTHKLLCRLKGGAFWWLMARLAGWDGVTP